MKKRLISVILIIALAAMLLPQTAFMAEDTECAHEHLAERSEIIGSTRGDYCYMLWRMAGRPESGLELAFDDVSVQDDRFPAYKWAVEKNIMDYDVNRNCFKPDETMQRGSAILYLWRYAGSPEPVMDQAPFDNILEGARYNKAVRWAVEAGWIELYPVNNKFRAGSDIGGVILDCKVCEDCGEIVEISKMSFPGECGDNLMWTFENGTLTIIGSGEMIDTEGGAAPWYQYNDEIRRVSFPSGLKSIGSRAFWNCYLLEEVVLPSNLRSIGEEAFADCGSLERVFFPDSVTDIGDGAFFGCRKLLIDKLPPNLKTIGFRAFSCSSIDLDERNWQDGILYFDGWALESEEDITAASIRAGTKKMAKGLFCDNPRLKDVSISAGVTEIGPWMLALCNILTGVEIPESVKCIGEYALYSCDRLASVTILNKECVIEEGEEEPEYMLGDPGRTTIYGYAGSTAQAYAVKYGYRFVELSEKVPYTDVPAKAFYVDPVVWAVENDITKGVDGTHFGPDNACTRGHVVTFLWRAAGCPEPENAETSFTDLKKDAYYEKAVAWAVENNITNGLSSDTFGPDATCTRGQIVAFLWRAAGCPEPENTETPFKDLKKGAFYEKAVAWAVENEITNGLKPAVFDPDGTCTRGQVVTFLYRATGEK